MFKEEKNACHNKESPACTVVYNMQNFSIWFLVSEGLGVSPSPQNKACNFLIYASLLVVKEKW